MDLELSCPHCGWLYHVPILLPCNHTLCLSCAATLQEPISKATEEEVSPDVDKASVLSDSDSGVSCNSRPTSIVMTSSPTYDHPTGNTNRNSDCSSSISSQSTVLYSILCPQCSTVNKVDDGGAHSLPKYKLMEALVDKYKEKHCITEKCQLCTNSISDNALRRDATVFCDQCSVYYCDPCRSTCHPKRGPLAAHIMMTVNEGKNLLKERRRNKDVKCHTHHQETLSMYCVNCQRTICVTCLSGGKHHEHEVHALPAVTQTKKKELKLSLHALSDRAKTASELIHKMKEKPDQVKASAATLEETVVSVIRNLMDRLERRREELVTWIREERDNKVSEIESQITEVTDSLHFTTSGLQFNIEALKENEPVAFMEASVHLSSHITSLVEGWDEVISQNELTKDTHLGNYSINEKDISEAINKLTVVKIQTPGTPSFSPDLCSAFNNSVTIAWEPQGSLTHTHFTLELDDGNQGDYKVVYSGPETICTIDGLHFASVYKARVRAESNQSSSDFTAPLTLHTSDAAWFSLQCSHPEVSISEDTVSSESYEHRVVVGSEGLSRGVHYWEFEIRQHDGQNDIAFGVVCKGYQQETILGKCPFGWSRYMDGKRSWSMHHGTHFNRSEGGVHPGDCVGVRLNTHIKTLTFYLNGTKTSSLLLQGSTNVFTVFYPAVSIVRGTTLTLRSGLPTPIDTPI